MPLAAAAGYGPSSRRPCFPQRHTGCVDVTSSAGADAVASPELPAAAELLAADELPAAARARLPI
eukprot:2193633-Prymnesium_polylepis.1